MRAPLEKKGCREDSWLKFILDIVSAVMDNTHVIFKIFNALVYKLAI